MKIEELIETLQEEQKIHPYAEVVIGFRPDAYDGKDIINIIHNGQKVVILP